MSKFVGVFVYFLPLNFLGENCLHVLMIFFCLLDIVGAIWRRFPFFSNLGCFFSARNAVTELLTEEMRF